MYCKILQKTKLQRLQMFLALVIKIVWQGFKKHSGDQQRSISLKNFLQIFLENIQIYSLQKGPGEDQLLRLPEIYKVIKLGVRQMKCIEDDRVKGATCKCRPQTTFKLL